VASKLADNSTFKVNSATKSPYPDTPEIFVVRYHCDVCRYPYLSYFLIANFAPQTEHLPSLVIFGCSLTSIPHSPHFTKFSPQSARISLEV